MAVKIEFQGEGDQLLASLVKQRDLAAATNEQFEKLNASVKKQGTEGLDATNKFTQGIVTAGVAVADLNKKAGSGLLTQLAKDMAATAKSAGDMGQSLSAAGDITNSAFQELLTNTKAAAAQQGVVVKAIDASKKATLDALVAAKSLTAEEAKLAQEAIEVVDAFRTQARQSGAVEPGIKKADAATKSLRQQLREAREELARLDEASDGKITPELVAAAQRAGILQDRLGDVNATIQAFNPDAKFQAFTQIVQAGAGALTAFQGVMGLVNTESETVQKTLLKVQSALAITQGLQAFFGGFRDGIRNARAVLLSLTATQRASTAATVTGTAATAAQGATTVATTTATGGLTAALNALKTAAISNPFTSLLVGMGAVIGLLLAFRNDTEEATKTYQELVDTIKRGFDLRNLQLEVAQSKRLAELEADRLRRIEEVNAGRRKSTELTKEEAAKQASDQMLFDDAATLNALENIDKREKELIKLGDLVKRGFERDTQGREPSEKQREDALRALGLPDDATMEDANKALTKFNDEFLEEKAATEIAVAQIEQKGLQSQADSNEKELKLQQDRLRETKDFNDNLIREIDRLNKEVEARLRRAKLDAASPSERIELEQQFAQEALNNLERDMLRRLALIQLEKKLGVAAIKSLSEERQNALADARIAEGGIQLSPEQIENLNALRFDAERRGQKALSELLVSEANARIELITNAEDRERAVFEAALTAKVDAFRKAGQDEEAIQTFVDQQRAQFTATRKAKAIDAEEQIALAQIDAQIANAAKDEQLRFQLELKKLDIQKAFAQARLAAVEDDGSKGAAVLKAGFEKQIAEIDAARAELETRQPKFSLLGLLGVKPEDEAAVKEGLQSLLNSVKSIIDQGIAAQEEELRARTAATDAVIADAQRRRSELQRELDQELEAAKLGLANNVDAKRQQLADLKTEEEKALAEKKKIAEEEKKIAKQRAIADAISQASALVTAGAVLFSQEVAKGGIVGVFTAIAGIAAMVAAFLNLKNTVSKFREGGAMMLQGPSHEGGGLAVVNKRTGQVQGEAEGGEAAIFFTRREHAKKAMPFLQAINANDIAKLHRLAAKEIGRVTSANNIMLEPDEKIQEFAADREAMVIHHTVVQKNDNARLEKAIKSLEKEVASFKRQEGDKPEVINLPSGAVRIKRKTGTETIHPKKSRG